MGCQVPVAPAWHRPERSGDLTRGFDSHHPEIIHLNKKIERVMGIEPTYLAWKASVLPLNYTRTNRGDRIRTCGLLIPNQAL